MFRDLLKVAADLAVVLGVLAAVLILLAGLARGQQIPVNPPAGVPVTAAQVELGKMLYFDPRLSADGTIACVTCHQPERGYSDGLMTAVGIRGQLGTFNSPTVLNSAYYPHQFWDGRTLGQSLQAVLPLVNPIEMGNVSQEQVAARLRGIPGYVSAFERAFGGRGIGAVSVERIGQAIAAFETTLVSNLDTPLHRRLAGDVGALGPVEEIGLGLVERAGCFSCHRPPLFTDRGFHNNGFEFASTLVPETTGRADVDGRSIRAFKTPSWLELARTYPYGHNGRFVTLEAVVAHYSAGGARRDGRRDPAIDRRVVPQNWSKAQQRAVARLLAVATASPTYPIPAPPRLP